jgi:hypothetical protein
VDKPRRMKAWGDRWERAADEVARAFCPPIYPCADCGGPVVDGYCCTRCGSSSPQEGTKKPEKSESRQERGGINPKAIPALLAAAEVAVDLLEELGAESDAVYHPTDHEVITKLRAATSLARGGE